MDQALESLKSLNIHVEGVEKDFLIAKKHGMLDQVLVGLELFYGNTPESYLYSSYLYGVYFYKKGNLEKALAFAETELIGFPGCFKAHMLKGGILKKLGRHDKAYDAFNAAANSAIEPMERNQAYLVIARTTRIARIGRDCLEMLDMTALFDLPGPKRNRYLGKVRQLCEKFDVEYNKLVP
ncbi:MAG: hypothetical protein KAT43_05350 [Nanoarchaeota archaeon]|nr:hypothetical protein [Nanoarchaeota archaeon]